jgi:hypothetical protein
MVYYVRISLTRRHTSVQKLANIGLIAVSMSVGFATSWYVSLSISIHSPDTALSRFVYREVMQRIRHLEGFSPEVDELAAEAIEDADENDPLIHV